MAVFSSCEQAVQDCVARQTFSVSHLYKEEKAMAMHIHDCYEVYYSISGGRQFLIGSKIYSVAPGDLFIINQYESHQLSDADSQVHERIILHFHPSYVSALSSPATDLNECFSRHPAGFQHKISLSKDARKQFLYHVDKLTCAQGYAGDIMQQAAVLELLVLLNRLSSSNAAEGVAPSYRLSRQVDEVLAYINQNLSQQITTQALAEHFYMSQSYLCRIFKKATGTTVNKYITARRITVAKALLSQGHSVSEAYERSGFSDYSSFFKAFTKAVGLSPKKYATASHTA